MTPPSRSLSRPFLRRRGEYLALLCLVAVAFLARWPLRGGSLEEYDSANYAFALREINLEKQYPHPPGYIFFVWTSRLARSFTGDDIAALTAVNAVSGVLSIVLLYALLRGCMQPMPALLSVLFYTTSAQVWFQHVRPLQDAFAFTWMLAAAYPFVRLPPADRRGWLTGMFMVGLAAGAKQILPLFLMGLPLRAALELARRRQGWTLLLGVGTALAGSLSWLVPLSLAAGSLPRYLAWALTQAEWQRQEALVMNLSWPVAWDRVRATFLLIWTDAGLAWLFGALIGVGVWAVLRRRPELRWLLWLLCPLLLVRFLLLGFWTRFSLYYLPFLLVLAVCGLEALAAVLARSASVARSGSRPDAGRLLQVEQKWFASMAVACLGLWAPLQALYILPTLHTLHDAPAPMAALTRYVRDHYDPRTTLVLLPDDSPLVSRHAEYYLARSGFRHVKRTQANPVAARTKQTVLQIEPGVVPRLLPPWYGSSERRGIWSLNVPHWDELSLWNSMWRVGLFEVIGPYVSFYNWHDGAEHGRLHHRCADEAGSTIVILRTPPMGMRLRLRASPAPASGFSGSRSTAWGAIFTVGKRLARPSRTATGEILLEVVPEAIVNGRVRIDVHPDCPPSPVARFPFATSSHAEVDARRECFCLTGLDVVSGVGGAVASEPGMGPPEPRRPRLSKPRPRE